MSCQKGRGPRSCEVGNNHAGQVRVERVEGMPPLEFREFTEQRRFCAATYMSRLPAG